MASRIDVHQTKFYDLGDYYPIGSPRWFLWLQIKDKFRFDGLGGKFTAYKAERSGSEVWYGQKRKDGILRTQYLGKSEDLNVEVLEDAAKLLNLPKAQWLNRDRKRPTKSKTQTMRLTKSERSLWERDKELRQLAEQEVEQLKNKLADLSIESNIKCETNEVVEILKVGLRARGSRSSQALREQVKRAIRVLESDS